MHLIIPLLILCFFYPTLRMLVVLVLGTWYFGWQIVLGMLVLVVVILLIFKENKVSTVTRKKSKEAIEMEQRKAKGLESKSIKDIFNKSKIPKQEYVKSAEMKQREIEALKLKDIFRKK